MTGRLPRGGGLDDQPAARLAGMLFAERVRALLAKKAASPDWSREMTREDLALMALLYGDEARL